MMIMSSAQHRVLVIDDELGPRESLRMLLKNEFEVITAESVSKGLEFLKEKQPDAIIMDIRMPDMTGIEGLREIRHIDPNVSVIMLTGFGALETAQEAIRLGANDYVKKPFDTREMVDTVRRNVQRSEINRRRAHTEQELQDLNRRLVHELATKDRMASLGQASAELVHDLRNPLTVILGYVQILSEDLEKTRKASDGETQEAFDYIDVISSSVRRCRDLIEAWLNLARAGSRNFQPVALAQLVRETVHHVDRTARHRRGRIECEVQDDHVLVHGDNLQLSRVLQNLLGNAMDALPQQDGVIAVRCRKDGPYALVEVQDNGCGIPASQMDKVFEPYFTTKSVSQGTGLGLFITCKIVEDHGGTVIIESREGAGTVAVIRLPAMTPA
jgi:signal transduction histidine kinase